MSKPNGFVFYRGASMLDGAPVIGVITGTAKASANEKTGSMLQSWILREDTGPIASVHSGADASICGDCPLRGIVEAREGAYPSANRYRSCYVNVAKAPTAVWKAYHRGRYPLFDPTAHNSLVRGRLLRLGSYGEPTAVPLPVWSALARLSAGRTGYTHQWRQSRFWRFRRLVMASCETFADVALAQSKGWRTFRTGRAVEAPVKGEFRCPASAEAGKRLTCEQCGACNGADRNASRASVFIAVHGGPATKHSYERGIG